MISTKMLLLAMAMVAPLAIASTAAAQANSGKVFARYSKPLKSVSLDLATGTVTRGPAVNDRAGTTTVDFNNNDLSGFVGVDTGGGFCEWFDAGVKGFAGNASDLMNDFVFAYCSAKLAPASGGPGGTVKMGFYEGYQVFGGTPTTAVAVFTLSGLPGNSGSSSFFGGFSCFFIDITFGALVAFADGPIGYSWGFLDVGTDGILAGTWPFLSCVVSCSGAIGQVDGQGMTDAIDEYCPPGTLRSTFTFGTTSGSFTSMSMDIREATDFAATIIHYNAGDPLLLGPCFNPDILMALPAKINSDWTGTVTRSTGAAITSASLSVRCCRIPLVCGAQGPPPLPVGAGGRILISGAALSAIPMMFVSQLVRSFSVPIPNVLALVGVRFAAQATVLGGGVKVSSAAEGTVGTF
jgi:hypothetical protein